MNRARAALVGVIATGVLSQSACADSTGASFRSATTTTSTSAPAAGRERPVVRLDTVRPVSELPDWRAAGADLAAAAARPAGRWPKDLASAQAQAIEAAPPDSDQAAFRAIDPAGWMRLAIDIGRLRALNPPKQTRLMALVATASAAGMKYNQLRTAEPSPSALNPSADRSSASPISPPAEAYSEAGPADAVVAAGAAYAVLTELFPSERWRADKARDQTLNVAYLSGRWSVGDISRSWAIGEAAGRASVEASANDGSATPGEYTPIPAASYVPTPPVYGRAVEPNAGAWRLWNQCSQTAVPLPDPPAVDSPEFERARDQLVDVSQAVSDGDRRVAEQWSLGTGSETPPGQWVNTVADSLWDANIAVEDQAVLLAALSTAEADAAILIWREKYRTDYVRPITAIRDALDPSWSPLLVTPAFPSYPSGHSGFTAAAAALSTVAYPDRADEFLQAAAQAGDSRVIGGIHYWFDNRYGAELGWNLAASCAPLTMKSKVGSVDELLSKMTYASAPG